MAKKKDATWTGKANPFAKKVEQKTIKCPKCGATIKV